MVKEKLKLQSEIQKKEKLRKNAALLKKADKHFHQNEEFMEKVHKV